MSGAEMDLQTNNLNLHTFLNNLQLFLSFWGANDLLSSPPVNLLSPAHLLGAGIYHENHQICQVHRARHRSQTAALLHHRPAGPALRTPACCGDQCHPGEGEWALTSVCFIFICSQSVNLTGSNLVGVVSFKTDSLYSCDAVCFPCCTWWTECNL